MELTMHRKKKTKPARRSAITKDLFTPKYRPKVVPNRKKAAKAPKIEEIND